VAASDRALTLLGAEDRDDSLAAKLASRGRTAFFLDLEVGCSDLMGMTTSSKPYSFSASAGLGFETGGYSLCPQS